MRRLILPLLFLCLLFLSMTGLKAQFTSGNLAVFRAETASANNSTFSILELSPLTANQSSPVTTIAINGTTGPSALRTSGSATSTGYLANSDDGGLLCFTGHNSTTTSGNANTITARGVGTLDPSANFSLATTYTGGSGNQTRCATTLNNTNWFIADQGGVYTNGSSSASPSGNFRSIRSFGGTVYIFQASASAPPVSTLSATSGGTITGLPGLANGTSNNQDFYMISSGSNGSSFDVLYVLAATGVSAGTIFKYSLVSGSWVGNGTYTTSFGGFGIAAAKQGSGAFLYVTTGTGATAANSVLRLTDDAGYNTTISITTGNNVTLFTTSASTTLKGIAFAPVTPLSASVTPSPTSLSFGTVTVGTFSSGQTVTLTASNLNPSSGSLTATAPNANFQVFDGSTWGSTAPITYSGNGSVIGNIQVRFSPQSSGSLSGNLSITGGGLVSPALVSLSGTGDNNLSFNFSASTTAALNPPFVSGTINDPGDPAATSGIITTVQESGVDIPMANYSISVASSNISVVPVANVVVTKADGSATIKITPASVGYADITLTLTKGTDTRNLVINYAASTSSSSSDQWMTGMADASGAIALDNNYMVIANDEVNFLYVYNRNSSGLPAKTFDFNAGNILALTDGTPGNWKEVDVEAGTSSPGITGRTYWLGSMSNSSSFNNKPNRNRLFAVDISSTGSSTSFTNAGYYAGLRQQLITWGDANGYNFTASAADGKDCKTIDGFNAEGLVFGPDNTTLYVGFRAPLVPLVNRTKAVIAPIQNFETWFNNGSPVGSPTIGSPIELDLGSRGIRDLIRLSNGNYVILAGSYDGTLIPAAYIWTGNPADAPTILSSIDLTGLNAEGAMGVNEGGQLSLNKIQIICDNGDNVYYNDGVAAKDLLQDNYKKFISDVVQSSIAGVLPVHFESFTAQRVAANVQLNWKIGTADDAGSFDLMRSENGSTFTRIQTVQVSRNQTAYTFTDMNAPASRLYYRINAKDGSGQSYWSAIRPVNANGINVDLVKIYPNPVTDGILSILINKPGLKVVDIYNSVGILYKKLEFSETATDIQTGQWPKGNYLVRILTADGSVSTEKIIVQ